LREPAVDRRELRERRRIAWSGEQLSTYRVPPVEQNIETAVEQA
jgi:hypothetical protein